MNKLKRFLCKILVVTMVMSSFVGVTNVFADESTESSCTYAEDGSILYDSYEGYLNGYGLGGLSTYQLENIESFIRARFYEYLYNDNTISPDEAKALTNEFINFCSTGYIYVDGEPSLEYYRYFIYAANLSGAWYETRMEVLPWRDYYNSEFFENEGIYEHADVTHIADEIENYEDYKYNAEETTTEEETTAITEEETTTSEEETTVIEEETTTATEEETTASNDEEEKEISASVSYRTHVQKFGWQPFVKNGSLSGTENQQKRLEAIEIELKDLKNISGGIRYKTHVQKTGWQGWKSNGVSSGTTGSGLRLEAIKIELTGDIADVYDIYYNTHIEKIGWSGWAKNGETSGSAGYGLRLEAIHIKLVKKDANGNSTAPTTVNDFACFDYYKTPVVTYKTHVQKTGWQSWVKNNKTSGTVGKGLRLEAIQIKITDNKGTSGGITYRTHVEKKDWMPWVNNGALSGTSGKGLRLEAIQMKLTGDLANQYSILYRVHAQHFGWMGWAKDGTSAGTSGYGYRLEGIQIIIVDKSKTRSDLTIYPVCAGKSKMTAYSKYVDPYAALGTQLYQEYNSTNKEGTSKVANLELKRLIEEYRSQHGLASRWGNNDAYATAQKSSKYNMEKFLETRILDHYYREIPGENLAVIYLNSDTSEAYLKSVVSEIMEMWKNSAGHNRNLLWNNQDDFGSDTSIYFAVAVYVKDGMMLAAFDFS